MSERARVVIIGGGLAGAAAAWGLARAGHPVTLVEREPRPGMHASGRNAGMIRQVTGDPDVARLARAGARLLADPPQDLEAAFAGQAPLRRTGSVLLAGGEAAVELRRWAEDARAAGVDTELRGPGDCALGGIEPSPGAVAVVTASDGVADPHAVLGALLGAAKARGARVRLGRPARLVVSGGALRGVEIDGPDGCERLDAEVVINAAGPWAQELVAEAGGVRVGLRSYRRHLFYTGPVAGLDADAPWVWDVERGFYVRPESSGLLFSACDRELRPAEDTAAADGADGLLAERVSLVAPRYARSPVARAWAGLRTFASDELFVVGWDPRLRGLFWLTGLGGHGLTTSCALAEVVERGVAGRDDPALAAFDPARFAVTVRA